MYISQTAQPKNGDFVHETPKTLGLKWDTQKV